MPAPAHARLSLIGDLPDGEMFSCSLSLRATQEAAPDPDPEDWVQSDGPPAGFDAPGERCRDAATAFWARLTSGISERAILKRVKLAPIGADGHYSGPPKEFAVNVPGGILNANGLAMPHQMSRKVTLETDADLGRVKGGFYLPSPTIAGWTADTNLFSVGQTEGVRDSVKTFLDDIEFEGILSAGFQLNVVIASGGRMNPDGSVRLAPGLHRVKRVNVGRRVDVQRRRANKLSEARIADAALEGGL